VAVRDRTFRPYAGPSTDPSRRFLVVTRYGLRESFRSRLATIVFAAAFLLPIGGAVFVYLRYNLRALQALGVQLSGLIRVDSLFFMVLMSWQSFAFGGLLALLIGPGLVSSDLANNALPLYLSRPLSKGQYILGKLAVLALLLSAITWVPGLLLFGLQAVLAGGEWTRSNLHLPVAILGGSLLWIFVLSLMALAASALTKRKVAAQSLLVGAVIGGAAIGDAINSVFSTEWGYTLNLGELMRSMLEGMYRVSLEAPLPLAGPLIALPLLCGGCVVLLAWRLKAKEVVR
jgi:ABC-2 type transport system permease protein